MDFRKKRLTCEEANRIDMVDYLASLGYQPTRISGHSYWYLSMLPERSEGNASFKVNRNRNQWYDFGDGCGGSFVDFGVRYHRCSVSDLLKTLSGIASNSGQTVSRPSSSIAKEPEQKIRILDDKPIEAERLVLYLKNRRIPLDVAQQYCREVTFAFKDKTYYAIGFRNDLGGYELRNEYYKSSSSPKDIRFLDHGADNVTVFEGFFDFLSFVSIHKNQNVPLTNFLILNSISFFEKSRPVMERHRQINLYLDNDASGVKVTQGAVQYSHRYKDHSHLYKGYDDLNDWVCRMGSPPGQRLPIQRHRKLHL